MKKLTLLLVSILVLSATACTKKQAGEQAPEGTVSEEKSDSASSDEMAKKEGGGKAEDAAPADQPAPNK